MLGRTFVPEEERTGAEPAIVLSYDLWQRLAGGRNLEQEGGALLFAALRFLGQGPPVSLEMASCREILAWGAANFDLSAIPRRPAPLDL